MFVQHKFSDISNTIIDLNLDSSLGTVVKLFVFFLKRAYVIAHRKNA